MSNHKHKAEHVFSGDLPIVAEHDEPEPVEEKELPYMAVLNPRKKLEPKFVNATDLMMHEHEKHVRKIAALQWVSPEVVREPVPKVPLSISWWPRALCFKLLDEVVVLKVFITNRSTRMIYMMYFGLWEDAARLGASWHCSPGTRFLVAPGLGRFLKVQATPREFSPIRSARAGIQIATGLPRDNVVGHFVIPIYAQFLTYVEPPAGEEGEGE